MHTALIPVDVTAFIVVVLRPVVVDVGFIVVVIRLVVVVVRLVVVDVGFIVVIDGLIVLCVENVESR